MQLSVFGLGHTGAVTAACLASQGHEVIAVDSDPGRVDVVRRGLAPINEPGLGQLIHDAVGAGRLRASVDIAEAIANSVLTCICGRASGADARAEPGFGAPLCEAIGAALRDKAKFHS